MLLTIRPVWAQNVGEQLKSNYQGKTLTRRHFYAGEDLRFGPDGKLLLAANAQAGKRSLNSTRATRQVNKAWESEPF